VRVRVREGRQEMVSRAFDIHRGVVHGDICSPYGYIIALAFRFYRPVPLVLE
jgi:hypothetical protein